MGRGTGLGLSVVHGIVQQHDGAIVVYSAPGKGTSFQLYFPEASGEEAAAAREPAAPAPGRGQRILAVDDEKIVLKVTEEVLRRSGYNVEVTSDPHAALEAFRLEPDKFDLVITDLTMPRMKGTGLAEQILKLRPGFPILLSTGFAGNLNLDEVHAMGIRGPLLKPFSAEALVAAVGHALAPGTDAGRA